ncbi:DUF4810 domain-containing protein [Achromobacter anxifer]|uniref:DUF4810 domain-containing protein n=1 Tax=Achromobacter anxifer TaxID=1287737 RepID=UPI00155CA327|nr:DUF4810 domain-containing protein [Achromobacter anxifer]MDF8364648.1 DUF4810 domain-containing protein [Achromobacter anxifer]CAB5510751.1 hypothetical protein LMG26857_00032 [Achromobacter anxifer]
MKRLITLPLVAAALLLSAGCAQNQGKYTWGKYDDALHSFYKQPGQSAEYMAELEKTIQTAEAGKRPLAPGIYAEYGYMLMLAQRNGEAVTYFQKEKAAWPESARFMDGMIKTAGGAVDTKPQAGDTKQVQG